MSFIITIDGQGHQFDHYAIYAWNGDGKTRRKDRGTECWMDVENVTITDGSAEPPLMEAGELFTRNDAIVAVLEPTEGGFLARIIKDRTGEVPVDKQGYLVKRAVSRITVSG